MHTIAIAWIFRCILVFLASTVWWICMSLEDIPIKAFTLLYLRMYCFTSVALICSLLLTVDYYVLQAEPVGPVAFYYPSICVCFGLSLLFPLVVITHWVFCSKLTWHHWLVIPLYIIFGLSFLAIERYTPIIAKLIRWRNFVIAIAIFHIYPTFIPGNVFGIIGAVLTIIAHVFSISPNDREKRETLTVLAFSVFHLAAGVTTAMSFVPMILHKPSENSDWSEYLSYSLSYAGVGKYAGNVEYHCYRTTDYYGIQVRS